MDKYEMERLAFIISKELGSVKGDEELLESIRQNYKLFRETANKLAEPPKPAKVMRASEIYPE